MEPTYHFKDEVYCLNKNGLITVTTVTGSRVDSYGQKDYQQVVYTLLPANETTPIELPENRVFASSENLIQSLQDNIIR